MSVSETQGSAPLLVLDDRCRMPEPAVIAAVARQLKAVPLWMRTRPEDKAGAQHRWRGRHGLTEAAPEARPRHVAQRLDGGHGELLSKRIPGGLVAIHVPGFLPKTRQRIAGLSRHERISAQIPARYPACDTETP